MTATTHSGWPTPSAARRDRDSTRLDGLRSVTSAEVTWKPLYERAAVEKFLSDMEAERAHLAAEIEVAQAQRDAARRVRSTRELEAQAELGALVFTLERQMAELEDSHREVIATIRDAAEAEASRVLAAARREVAAMRDMTATLLPLVTGQQEGLWTDNRGEPATATHSGRDQADAG